MRDCTAPSAWVRARWLARHGRCATRRDALVFVLGCAFALLFSAPFGAIPLPQQRQLRRVENPQRWPLRILPRNMGAWCPNEPHGHENGGGAVKRLLQSHRENQLVIDVGAFDGSDALSYASAGHRVLSFEPSPSKAARIRARIARSGFADRITFVSAALADFNGSSAFVVSVPDHASDKRFMRGGSGVHRAEAFGSEQDGFAVPWSNDTSQAKTIRVPVRRLDDFVTPLESVLLLKVDAQGYDLAVLRGAEALLRERRVAVVVAELPVQLMPEKERSALALFSYMHGHGYRCARCDHALNGDTAARFEGVARNVEEYVRAIGAVELKHRNAQHGGWDNIVCLQ